jgi:hypothetical protein
MSASPEPAEPTNRAVLHAWLWWVGASAGGAVSIGLLHVITQRQFGHHFAGQLSVLLVAVILFAATPALLQGLVLKRLAGGPAFVAWIVLSWFSAIVVTVGWSLLGAPSLDADRAFDTARILAANGGRVAWPWLALALYATAISLLYNLVPIMVLALVTRRRALAFLLATVIGACAAVLLHKLYTGFVYLDVRSLYAPFDTTRAQAPWRALAQPLATLALFGMIQGAISGFGLARMFAPAASGARMTKRIAAGTALRVFGLVALVLIAAHLARYAVGPGGYQVGFPDLRRLASSAPAGDRSTGAPILDLSRRIALPAPVRYVVPSPDGRAVLLLTSTPSITDQSVISLDAQTGAFAPAPLIATGSARSIAFSPDGRTLAVNREGRRRGERDYHLGRIRLFATEGFAELADVSFAEQDCTLSRHMAFSADSGGLWVLCESSRDRPQDLLAVELALPRLDVVERRTAPAGEPRAYGSSSATVAGASGVFVGGYELRDLGGHLSVTDVTTSTRPLLAPVDMAKAVPGGPGVGFCGLHLSLDAAFVTVAHCVPPIRFKGDASAQKGQYRTFRTDTGELVADFGRQASGQDPVTWTVAFDRAHGRFAGLGTTAASKTGALVVWDQASGRELQRIETAAYRTGAFSADGQWLLLVGRDEDVLSIYRATP